MYSIHLKIRNAGTYDFIGEITDNAILYNNGKDVRVWSIVRIPPEGEK